MLPLAKIRLSDKTGFRQRTTNVRSRTNLARPPAPLPPACPRGTYVWQEEGDDAHPGEPRADAEDELHAGLVGQPAEEGGAYAAQTEHEAEEDAGDEPHLVGIEVGGVDHDGREGGGDDQSRDDGHEHGERQVEIGHEHGEGGRAQYGEEDDVLAAIPVAQEAPEERARREGRQVGEEAELRLPHGDVEALDEEEGEVARHAGVEEVLGEDERHQHRHGPACPAGRRTDDGGRGPRRARPEREHGGIPGAHPHQDERGQQGRRREPAHGPLPVGQDDGRRQQRSHGAAPVAAHLEDGLRQALPAARGHLRHPRGLGVEDRRAAPDERDGEQDGREAGREGQGQQPRQGEAHAQGEGVGPRVAVGVKPYEGLEDGGSHLEDQRDDAYLGEGEPQAVLDDGIHGGDDGLHHVVEQVAEAHGDEHGVGGLGLHAGMPLQFLYKSHFAVSLASRWGISPSGSREVSDFPPLRQAFPPVFPRGSPGPAYTLLYIGVYMPAAARIARGRRNVHKCAIARASGRRNVHECAITGTGGKRNVHECAIARASGRWNVHRCAMTRTSG